MDAKTIRLTTNTDGQLNLTIPADIVQALQLNDGDEVDLIPTASGFEFRKVDAELDKTFWDPMSQTLNEYERALKYLQGEDPKEDVSAK